MRDAYVRKLLGKAKQNIKAIVMDQDGTIKGGGDLTYTSADVLALLKRIVQKNKHPVIITASGVSALKSYSTLVDFYKQKPISVTTYIGIGNGVALYKFDNNGRNKIYERGLPLDEERAIIQTAQDLYKDLNIEQSNLQPKGIDTFKAFMMTDWNNYLPEDYIDLFKQYDGVCFTEPIKVSVVFPALGAERQRELVRRLQAELNNKFGDNTYTAIRGDDTFLHIIRYLDIDSKLFAMRTVMKELNLKDTNVVVFGDLPLDNDRGILIESGLPYTFTNHKFGKFNPNKPPYILPDSSVSPVGSVYKAIDYLLC